MNNLEDWEEVFLDKFAVMLERYTSAYPGDQAEEMIEEVIAYISSLFSSLQQKIEEKRKYVASDTTDNEEIEKIGYNTALSDVLDLFPKK